MFYPHIGVAIWAAFLSSDKQMRAPALDRVPPSLSGVNISRVQHSYSWSIGIGVLAHWSLRELLTVLVMGHSTDAATCLTQGSEKEGLILDFHSE